MNINDRINNFKLKNLSRKINFKKDKYKYKKVDENLNTQIEIDRTENENKKNKVLTDNLKSKLENSKTKIILSKINRVIEYYNEISLNQKKEIKNILKRAKKNSRYSLITGIVSALTTCMSIYNDNETIYIETFIFQCVAIIFASLVVNLLLNVIVEFYEKFYEKENVVHKGVMCTILIIIISYTIYSVITNYFFWKKYFKGIAVILFSVIFDFSSISTVLISNIYKSLKFNEKYIDEINKTTNQYEEKDKEGNNENTDDNIIELNTKKKA